MGTYLLKRLLFFLPTLILISVLAFFLSKTAPGDPVELYHRGTFGELGEGGEQARRIYADTRAQLGLDKPAFYFAFTAKAYPDTLYRIEQREHRQSLRQLIRQNGNWPAIQAYYRSIGQLSDTCTQLPDTLAPETVNQVQKTLSTLPLRSDTAYLQRQITRLDTLLAEAPLLDRALGQTDEQLLTSWQDVRGTPRRTALYTPVLYWYGFDNQYHHWLSGMLRGHFGRSYLDGQPAAAKIGRALRWTLLINLIAIILAYGLSIPLGVYMAVHKDSRFDRITTIALFMLYSLPSFWIGSLLLVIFTDPQLGWQFFSITRVNDAVSGDNFWQLAGATLRQITLPVFCLVYGSLAFIARQMRGGMIEVLQQDFIRTARAKGLPEQRVIWKHAFRNALFPLITLFASLFPAMLAGSVVIEYIFNIPGMGKLTVDSIRNQDWPVVYVLLLLSAVMTMAGILLADLLYALVDPRVSYQKKRAS